MPKTERPFYRDPARYLEHLRNVPQLPAPPEILLLSSAVLTFDEWLDSEIGQAVTYRIQHNDHRVSLNRLASYFDTVGDVQQKAMIYLWMRWRRDVNFTRIMQGADGLDHQAGAITRAALWNGRDKYTRWRWSGREQQTDILYGEVLVDDRQTEQSDLKVDVESAIERVVNRMRANYRRAPVEHVTRTIIDGYRLYYHDRYSQKGGFRAFCASRGVSKNMIQRWRPIIFHYLREALSDYLD